MKDKTEEITEKCTSMEDLFSSTHVSAIFPSKTIITCNDVDTMDVAFKSLIEHRVLSLPVWSKQHRKHLGFVDITDLVAFMKGHFSKDILMDDDIQNFLSAKDRFTTIVVKDMVNLAGRNPWYPVESSAPLRRLLNTFCRGNIHRLPILEEDGEFYCILSQTDMVAFIANNITSSLFKDVALLEIEKEQIGTWGNVHSVNASDPALAAFEKINELKVHGVGVVDDAGKLVSNISASDLRLIGHQGASLAVLYKTCSEFIEVAHGGGLVCVSRNATFVEIVQTLSDKRLHRVYVVDEAGKPVAVISQIDVLLTIQKRMK